MDIEQIRAHSKKIKTQADALLKQLDLITILSAFGTPHIIGSYATDLMYNPDLDIIVTSDHPRASSVAALHTIVGKQMVQKLEYGDFITFKRDERPEGCIIVLRAETEGIKWEIEIWFLESAAKGEKDVEHINSMATTRMRDTILEFKHLVSQENISKHVIASPNIYEAVVDKGITDFNKLVEAYAVK
jgi:hypothetical protein